MLFPGEYLIVWADDDEEDQGEMHATFKLSASGEQLYLSDMDLNILDEVVFGQQDTDMGYARVPNGVGDFVIQLPTFASNNEQSFSVSEFDDNTDHYRKLIFVSDLLGKSIYNNFKGSILLYIYDDGSIEKKYIVK